MTFALRHHSVVRLIISTVVILVFTTSYLHAQKFSLGVKAGPSISWMYYGDSDNRSTYDSKAKLGYFGSGLIIFPMKKEYSCVIEGGYAQRGRVVEYGNGAYRNDADYNFAEGSLLLRKAFPFRLSKNVRAKMFVNIGPRVSYWLSGKGTIGSTSNDGQAYTAVFEQEYTGLIDFKMYHNNVNRWLFGLDIGVGMQAPIKATQNVLVELRFTSGHTYFGSSEADNAYNFINFQDNLRSNEKILSLSVAYTFDIDLKLAKKGHSTKDKEVKRKPVRRRRG